MADINYNDHASKAAPTTDDFVPIWDVAASQSKKATIASLFNTRLTGGGIVATGGFTLTVPATGTAALLGATQTFTAAQTIAPAGTTTRPLTLNNPSSTTAAALHLQENGSDYVRFSPPNTSAISLVIDAWNHGSAPGPAVRVGRNSNGSTPAAARLIMESLSGTPYILWVDNAGILRIHTSSPIFSTDTVGTVVGAQTSALAAKDVLGEVCTPGEALAHLHHAAKVALRRFKYKLGQYNSEEFEGLVVDYAPRYGMDAGRSLNLPTLFSDLIQAVTMLAERVEHLEAGQ